MSDIAPSEATVADKAYKIPANLETGSSPDNKTKAPKDIKEAKKELTEKLLTHCDTTERAITDREADVQERISMKIHELSKNLPPHEQKIAEELLAQSQNETLPEDTIKAMVDKISSSSSGLVASRVKEGYKEAISALGMNPIPDAIKQRINKEHVTPKDVVELFMTADDLSNDNMKNTIRTSMDQELQKALAMCPENKFIQLSVAKLQERMGINPQVEPTQQAADNTPDAAPAQPMVEQPNVIVPSVADITTPEPQDPPPPTEQPVTVIEGTFVGTSTHDNGVSGDTQAQEAAREVQKTNAGVKLGAAIAAYQDRTNEARENSEQFAAQANRQVDQQTDTVIDQKDTPSTEPIPTQSISPTTETHQERDTQRKQDTTQPSVPDNEIATDTMTQALDQIDTIQQSLIQPMNFSTLLSDIRNAEPGEIQAFMNQYHEVKSQAINSLPQPVDMASLLELKTKIAVAEEKSNTYSFLKNPFDKFKSIRTVATFQKEYNKLDEANRKKFGDDYQRKIDRSDQNFSVTFNKFSLPFQDAQAILTFSPLQKFIELNETNEDKSAIRKAQYDLDPFIGFADSYKKRQQSEQLPIPIENQSPEEQKAA